MNHHTNKEKILSEEMSHLDLYLFFKLLLGKKIAIVLITFIFIVLGLILALVLSPWFTATVTVLPPNSGGNMMLGQYAGLASMVGIDLGTSSGSNQNLYPEIVTSDYILDKVLKTKFKSKSHSSTVDLFEFWESDPDTTEMDWENELWGKAKKRLREDYISADVDIRTEIFTLAVSVPDDPILAAEIANFIIDELEYYNKFVKKFKAREQKDYIEKSLADTEEQLLKAEDRLQYFLENNMGINSPKLQIQEGRLRAEVEMQKTIYIELRKQLELVKIEEIKEVETLNILDRAIEPYKKSKPKRALIVIGFAFLGVIFSVLYIFGDHYIQSKKMMYQ